MSDHYDAKYVVDAAAPSNTLLFGGPEVNKVTTQDVSTWLKKGWQDLKTSPFSLFYGLVFAFVGITLSRYASNNPVIVFAATTGFLLLGPFLGLGIYELSRSLEKGEKPDFTRSLLAIANNFFSLVIYAGILGAMLFLWVRLSMVVATIFFDTEPLQQSMWTWLGGLAQTDGGLLFLLSFFGAGLLFAVGAFVTGVVTVPLLMDRKLDIVTAVSTSLRVCAKNPAPMLKWALLITVIIGLGLATYDIGLIIAMPLVAHASWHAYKATVK